MNLRIEGENITITGDVAGKNVLILAEATDDAGIGILTVLDNVVNPFYQKHYASIDVKVGAKIIAEQAIDLHAALSLTSFLDLSVIPAGLPNPFMLKIGGADISIKGALTSNKGVISVIAEVRASVAATNNGSVGGGLIPVAAGAVSSASKVTLDGAVITAARGVQAAAASRIVLEAEACGNDKGIPALSLLVAETDTHALVTGSARINAGANVSLRATSAVAAKAVSTAKDASASKSGFIAVNVLVQNTSAQVTGAGTKVQATGAVNISSAAYQRSGTRAIAVAEDAVDTENNQTLSLQSALDQLTGMLLAKAQDTGLQLLGQAAGKVAGEKLSEKVDNATDGAKDDTKKESTSETQLAGALSVVYGENKNLAGITGATIQAGGALGVRAVAETVSALRADGSLNKSADNQDSASTAVGAAVGVAAVRHENGAVVGPGASIQSKGLRLEADSHRVDSTAVVKAGKIPPGADFGLAGAISVHIVAADTKAQAESAAFTLTGGSMEVAASGIGRISTVADASGAAETPESKSDGAKANDAGGASGDPTGIGAGIAVAVTGMDVTAKIADTVNINLPSGVSLAALRVGASFAGEEETVAKAGAKGGVAVVPVLALDVSGVNVSAYLGGAQALTVAGTAAGDARVEAAGAMERKLEADADAAGGSVGVGAAIGITIVNDSVEAILNRSLSALNIGVTASSLSRLTETVKAGANGAAPESAKDTEAPAGTKTDANSAPKEGEAEEKTKKNVAAAEKLADSVGTKNVSTDSVKKQGESRQKAETTEGSIQVAAALALAIVNNGSGAQIGGGLTLNATKAIIVQAKNDTDSVISANASATNSTVGVGVAAAVNVVSYENTATVGASAIKCDTLVVAADIIDESKRKKLEEAMRKVMEKFTGADALGNVQAMLNAYFDLGTTITGQTDLDSWIGTLDPSADKEAAKNEILGALKQKLTGENALDFDGAFLSDAIEKIVTDLLAKLSQPETLLGMITSTANTNPFQNILNELTNGLDAEAKKAVMELVTMRLAIQLGNPAELDGVGHLISTSAISGVGAANVGVAGAAAITAVNGVSRASVDTGAGGAAIAAHAEIHSDSAQTIYTTATASADDKGKPDKNPSGSGKPGNGGASIGIGASAAVSVSNLTSEVLLGGQNMLTAKTLAITANARNDVDTISVSGVDPIARKGDTSGDANNDTTTKSIAVDASVSITLIENTVTAQVAQGAKITTTGADAIETGDGDEKVSFLLRAAQKGDTQTKASAFAASGSETKAAVGASVALNLAGSKVAASFLGSGTVAGSAKVEAVTYNEDTAAAWASVVGASVQRMADRLNTSFAIGGSAGDTKSVNSMLYDKIYAMVTPVPTNGKAGSATTADKNAPLSSGLLAKQNLNTPTTPDTEKADKALGDNASTSTGKEGTQQASQQFNIAAAVAVNITGHSASAQTLGTLVTAGPASVISENHANYRTLATGAAACFENGSNNIAAAAAVTVNRNQSEAVAGGSLTTPGDVTIRATLTQNMDGAFRGLLGAQAVAGSIGGGDDATAGVAGAFAVMASQAETTARILANAVIEGGNITLEAMDKSKYALRAGSLTATGASVGVGASFAVLYTENKVTAEIGAKAQITGNTLKMRAETLRVDGYDYQLPFGWEALFSLSNQGDAVANTSVIHLTVPNDASDGILVEVNPDTNDLLKLLDMLNYLSSVNYYVEAIAGSVATGGNSNLTLAGAFAVMYAKNITQAVVGKEVKLNLTGGCDVDAKSDTVARLFGGSLALSTGNAVGVGLNLAAAYNENAVEAEVRDNTAITAGGNIKIGAASNSDSTAVTVAAGASADNAAVGGGMNFIWTKNKAEAIVGEKAALKAGGDLAVTALISGELIQVSADAAVSGGSAAIGGTVAVTIAENEATSNALEGARLIAGGSAKLGARSDEKLLTVLSSVSGSSDVAVAGTIGVQVSGTTATAFLGKDAVFTAENGSAAVIAEGKASHLTVVMGLAGSGECAAGAAVTVSVFDNKSIAEVGESARVTALKSGSGNHAIVQATMKEESLIITAAGAASGGAAIAGAIPVIVGNTEVKAIVGDFATMEAGDSVVVAADLNTKVYSIALAASVGGNVAVGASISTMVLNNQVLAEVGRSAALIARVSGPAGSGYTLPGRSNRRRGVLVSAHTQALVVIGSVGLSGGSVAVSGAVSTFVDTTKANADVKDGAKLAAGFDNPDGDGTSTGDGDILVEADDETDLCNFAGSLVFGGSAGAGVAAVVTVFDKDVASTVGNGQAVASQDITVHANATDNLNMIALNFSGGGDAGVGVSAAALVFQSNAKASAGGTVSAGRDVKITATSGAGLLAASLAVAGAGGAAVTPVAAVVYFEGSTQALVDGNAKVTAKASTAITATSKETVQAYVIGVALSGSASVSGTVGVIVSKRLTEAAIGVNAVVEGAGVEVCADDLYAARAAGATIAASGGAAVSVTALVNILHATTKASVNQGAKVAAKAGDVKVLAQSEKHIESYSATLAGGSAGVGVLVLATVVGGQLDQDSADQLSGGFKPGAFMNQSFSANQGNAKASGYNKGSDLALLLAGDGVNHSGAAVGSGGCFDAETGYRDPAFDKDTATDPGAIENDNNTSPGSGAKIDPDANGDISRAGGLYANTRSTSQSSVLATVESGAEISTARGIQVLAFENLLADQIAGVLAAGGVGVGAGVAVAVLQSGVEASVKGGAVLFGTNSTNISVIARSGSTPVDDLDAVRIGTLKGFFADNTGKTAEDDYNFTLNAIRSLVIIGSGGTAGVSVAVAAVVASADVTAYMDGMVYNCLSLNVQAIDEYPQVLAATLAAGAGAAAVNASVAIAVVNGAVNASIANNAYILARGKVTVQSDVTLVGVTAAVALGAGNTAVNGALSLVVNRTDVRAYVGQGVNIPLAMDLSVHSNVNSVAKTYVLSVALGSTAASLSGAVSILSPTVLTYVGVTPTGTTDRGSVSTGIGELYIGKTLTIKNDTRFRGSATVLSATAGLSAAINGSALLVYNDSLSMAGISRMPVRAITIDITAELDTKAEALLASATAGTAAIGFSVSYARLGAKNIAFMDKEGASGSGTIVNIKLSATGNTSAIAQAIAGVAGAVTVGINAAIADNNTQNIARITGSGTLKVDGTLDMQARATATAKATVLGASISGVGVAASFAAAVLRAYQEALLGPATAGASGPTVSAGTLTVESHLNENASNPDTAASILLGGGNFISAKLNVAVAYGRSMSIALVQPAQLTLSGNITAGSYGTANVAASVATLNGISLSYLSASLSAATAHAQARFDASLILPAAGQMNAGDVKVGVNYQSNALANLTPSPKGAVAAAGIKVSLAVALVETSANAALGGTGRLSAKTVNILADGLSQAAATISSPAISAGLVTVSANIAYAKLYTVQSAVIKDTSVTATGAVNVLSKLNNSAGFTGAAVSLGGNGGAVSASYISAAANVGIAQADAQNKAAVEMAAITTPAPLEVSVAGTSTAEAKAANDILSVSAYGIGVNVLRAYANGTFESLASGTITAQSFYLLNAYETTARAISSQPGMGMGVNASVSLLNVKANEAVAVAGTVANTSAYGGVFTAAGALDVKTRGTVSANAVIEGKMFSINAVNLAVNKVDALLAAKQASSVNGAKVTAGGVWVLSEFTGVAKAEVGSNGVGSGFSFTLVGGEVSLATANAQNTVVDAFVESALMNVSGTLEVLTNAKCTADALVRQPTNIAMVSNSAVLTSANANGAYTSRLQASAGGSVKAGDIAVIAEYTAISNATVAALGTSVAALSVNVNTALANTGVNASARIIALGTISANTIGLRAQGNARAVARGLSSEFGITIGRVGVNLAVATLDAAQSAFMEISANGRVTTTGAIEIQSLFTFPQAGKNEALAEAGSSVTGITLSLLSAEANIAAAYAQAANSAGVRGFNGGTGGGLSAASLTVNAKTQDLATANAVTATNVALLAVGVLDARAYARGGTEIDIADVAITTSGNVNVFAYNWANAIALSQAVHTVAAGMARSSNAQAHIGWGGHGNGDTWHISGITLRNADITSTGGNVSLKAENTGYANAKVENGAAVALTAVSNAQIPTGGYYNTYIRITGGNIQANNITVLTDDTPRADSLAIASQIGFAVSADRTWGENTVWTDNKITLTNASLSARNQLEIEANSKAYLTAKTIADNSGFISGTIVKAVNSLTRYVEINILGASQLRSDLGNTRIAIVAGLADTIYTQGSADTKSIGVAVGKAMAQTDVNGNATITIGGASSITSTLKKIFLHADASEGNSLTHAFADTRAFGCSETLADAVANVTLSAKVNIAGSGPEAVRIEAMEVDIRGRMPVLNVKAHGEAYGGAVANTNVRGNAGINAQVNASVTIGNALITGHDLLNVAADMCQASGPLYKANVCLDAYGEVYAVLNRNNDATASFGASAARAKVNLENGATFVGKDIRVTAAPFNGSVDQWAHTGIGGTDHRTGSFAVDSGVTINSGDGGNAVKFILGMGAGGIYVDISEENGNLDVRQVGMDGFAWTVNGNTIILPDIGNLSSGNLTLGYVTEVKNKPALVYNQSVIPEVTIVNRTGYNLQLGAVALQSVASPSAVYYSGKFAAPIAYTLAAPETINPLVTVENQKAGNVFVNGLIDNPTGTVNFYWTGAAGGKLTTNDNLRVPTWQGNPDATVAPVWAHILNIHNALSVGNSAAGRFLAYLFPLMDASGSIKEEAVINMTVSGASYTMFTPVCMRLVNSLPDPGKPMGPYGSAIRVARLASGGVNDILFGEALRMDRFKMSDTSSMLLPGTTGEVFNYYFTSTRYITLTMIAPNVAISSGIYYVYESGFGWVSRPLMVNNGVSYLTRPSDGKVILEMYDEQVVLNDYLAIASFYNVYEYGPGGVATVTKIGNDGSIKVLNKPYNVDIYGAPGTDYTLTDVSGADVNITLLDRTGNLIGKEINAANDVTITTGSTGRIGGRTYTVDRQISIPEYPFTITVQVPVYDPFIVNAGGSIAFNALDSQNKVVQGLITGNVNILSEGEVRIAASRVASGASLKINNGLTLGNPNSQGGGITFDSLRLDGNAVLSLVTDGDITGDWLTSRGGTSASLFAGKDKDIKVMLYDYQGGSLTAHTGRDFIFDVIDATDAMISIAAGRDITGTQPDSYLYAAGNGQAYLNVGRDVRTAGISLIGKVPSLIVDIRQNVKEQLLVGGRLSITRLELVGNGIRRTRPIYTPPPPADIIDMLTENHLENRLARNDLLLPSTVIDRETTLIDTETGVIVSGIFSGKGKLVVTVFTHHADNCPNCRILAEAASSKAFLKGFTLSVIGDYKGGLLVSIPVGDAYNGRAVTILCCKDDELVTITAVVKDGVVQFVTNTLGPMVILLDE